MSNQYSKNRRARRSPARREAEFYRGGSGGGCSLESEELVNDPVRRRKLITERITSKNNIT